MKNLLVILLLLFGTHTLPAAIPGAESLAKLITAEFDTNADGVIDQGEWQNGIANGFDKLDSNRDGSARPDEADALTKDLAEDSGDFAAGLIVALIKQVLISLDADGDKSVSRKEYDALSDGIFTKLDADKNSRLTLAEISELPLKLIAK